MKTYICAQASTRSQSRIEAVEPFVLGPERSSPMLKTVTRAPLLLRLAKTMTRWRIRGGHRLVEIFEQCGMLNLVAQYQLGRGVSFSVPLFRADTCWDQRDIETYETQLIHSFCRLLEPLSDVVLFDCGAD